MSEPIETRLLIDGVWCDADDGRRLEVLNPATGAPIGRVAHAGLPELQRAVESADRAFESWRLTGPYHRAAILHRAADLVRERSAEIARLITLEQGKPLAQAKIEADRLPDMIAWFAEEARRSYGQVIPARDPAVLQITQKVPVGVVVAFTPWNFPAGQVVRKLSAALAAGCTIIVKAPEETPASPAALIRCFVDAGVPPGAVSLVFGDPAEISGFLVPHPAIAKISFTGSTLVGKQLAAMAGAHMKRITMELGGHAPVVIFDDAELERAIPEIAAQTFRNAGQICISPTRFIVQDAAVEQVTVGLVDYARAMVVGDGMTEGVTLGPLTNARRLDALQALVDDAVAQGGRLLTGGGRIGNHGWFFEPTILADVPITARIMNEEPFGPVAIVNRFGPDRAAIAEANRLRYGLAAYAYTQSSARMQLLRSEIAAGMLTINHLGLGLPEVPFGGIRDSGYGTEGGSEAIESYLEMRFSTSRN